MVGYYNVEKDNILFSEDNVEFFMGEIDFFWMLDDVDLVKDNEG